MQRVVMIVLLAAAVVLVAVFVLTPQLRSTNPDEPLSYLSER